MDAIRPHLFHKLTNYASLSDGKFRHAAFCLDYRGRIISSATNTYKTHPQQARYAELAGRPKKISLHAEMSALIKATEDVETLLVCRVNKRGELRNSKPCPICSLAIEKSNIKTVWYSMDHGFECFHNLATV